MDVVAKLEGSWVTMQEVAPVPGYVCLVSQTHAVDLHDLPEADAFAFMRDARKVSMAVASVTGAVKMNYEIHGNSIPHLRMHFFPRYRGDQFEGQPINPRSAVQPVYAPGAHRLALAEIRGLILRMSCGEYLLSAEITGYNLRKRCG
jgi:diadenosine tetraphosphate (Ap4A) HIT family hydrolase